MPPNFTFSSVSLGLGTPVDAVIPVDAVVPVTSAVPLDPVGSEGAAGELEHNSGGTGIGPEGGL